LASDAGASVTLDWRAPAVAVVQFAILAAPSGGDFVIARMAPSNSTHAVLTGLDPHIHYCFLVAAVYSMDVVRSSPVCIRQ
jgi:hypothetical protein